MEKKKKAPSAWSKKMDQLSLSKAELNKGDEAPKLRKIAAGASVAFAWSCQATFGAKWWKQLVYSANKKKRTALGYALDVLLK